MKDEIYYGIIRGCLILFAISVYYWFINERNPSMIIWMVLSLLPIVICLITYAVLKNKKQKIQYNDFDNNLEYFHNLLQKYHPSVLSLITKNDNYPDLLIIGLYNLKLKEIDFSNLYNIESEKEKYTESDKLLIDLIAKNETFDIFKYEDYKILIIQEAHECDLLFSWRKNKVWHPILKISLAMLLAFLIIVPLGTFIGEGLSLVLGLLSIFIIYFIAKTIFIYNDNTIKTELLLTEEGEEISRRLIGLKNEIQNITSDAHNRFKDWEDYKIYKVIFNLDQETINEFKDYIK